MTDERTSKAVASDAGHLLSVLDELEADLELWVKRTKLAFSEMKSVAASALAQSSDLEDSDHDD